MTRRPNLSLIVTTIALPVLTAVIYATLLGYRHDYLRHWASGFGGTLGALMLVFAALPAARFAKTALKVVVPVCVACIVLRAALEASVFRLAKFDEVEACNQSLGAVLAVLLGWALVSDTKPDRRLLVWTLATAAVLVTLGMIDAMV